MDTDNTIVIILGAIVGLLVWAWILSAIIRSASRSKHIEDMLVYQMRLLIIMMQEKGIPDQKINEAFDTKIRLLKDLDKT